MFLGSDGFSGCIQEGRSRPGPLDSEDRALECLRHHQGHRYLAPKLALVTGPRAPRRSEGMLGRKAPSPVRHLKVAGTEKCP